MLGVIHREARAEAAFHEDQEEGVIVTRLSYTEGSYSSRIVTPLSIEAAAQLHFELGKALGEALGLEAGQDIKALERRIEAVENRLQRTLEVNNLWDGS